MKKEIPMKNEVTIMKKSFKVVFNSPVVIIFVAVCLAATILNYITVGFTNWLLFSTWHSSLSSPLTYVRFFTHVFGHADFEHFVGNMCYILLLGPMLEEKYSSKILIEVIAITAGATAVFNYILFPGVLLCGASGVVFAFIILSSFTGFREGEIPLTFILVAIFFLGQQILQGMFWKDNVSNMAHIIGGVVGAFLGYVLNKKKI